MTVAVLAAAVAACGQGLYDAQWYADREGGTTLDARPTADAAPTEDAPAPIDDAAADRGMPPDAQLPSACQRIDYAGGTVMLEDEAKLVIAANAVRQPTEVCLVRVWPPERRGAIERAYEIRLTGGVTRFAEPPDLEVRGLSAPAGVPFEQLSLAYLQRSTNGTASWVAIQDGRRVDALRGLVAGKVVRETADRLASIALVAQCERAACPVTAEFRHCSGAACQ